MKSHRLLPIVLLDQQGPRRQGWEPDQTQRGIFVCVCVEKAHQLQIPKIIHAILWLNRDQNRRAQLPMPLDQRSTDQFLAPNERRGRRVVFALKETY